MKYSKHTLRQKSTKDIATKKYEKFEGIFKTKFNKWVVRIKQGNRYKTIGQYDTKEDAEKVYSLNAL